jgi:hypothetical protein
MGAAFYCIFSFSQTLTRFVKNLERDEHSSSCHTLFHALSQFDIVTNFKGIYEGVLNKKKHSLEIESSHIISM